MKIGIFDSGLGGLIVLKAIHKRLPGYDYIYLGDTKRVPYGNRTPDTVYQYASECVDYLFKRGCGLIIIACNTVSVEALRRLQREYLPKHYPNRRILGVVVPTIEAVIEQKSKNVGVIGTRVTIQSKVYERELRKKNSRIRIFQHATPLLVPFVEEHEIKLATPVLKEYLKPLRERHIDSLILGCTHYCLLKTQIKKELGSNVRVIAQDAIVPTKLADYLKRHPDIAEKLSKSGVMKLLVTEKTSVYTTLATKWFDGHAKLKEVQL